MQQVETRGSLWHIKYPIEHHPGEFIVVATTRPETMLGDVAVAVHPDNERLKHLVGRHAILPLVGRRIPIVADEYADPEKGSGAVKITPAHDFNDFEVGRCHDLPLINVFDDEAHLTLKDNAPILNGAQPDPDLLDALEGKPREVARKLIVERLEAAGLIEKIEPTPHMVPHGDRSGAVLEPFLTDQWYVDAKTLAQPAIAAVREGRTKFIPQQWEATFFNWLENIQPWCISRQIWWGHQIPAWYGPNGKVFVAERKRTWSPTRSRITRYRRHLRRGTRYCRRSGVARALCSRFPDLDEDCSIHGSHRLCGPSRLSAGRIKLRN